MAYLSQGLVSNILPADENDPDTNVEKVQALEEKEPEHHTHHPKGLHVDTRGGEGSPIDAPPSSHHHSKSPHHGHGHGKTPHSHGDSKQEEEYDSSDDEDEEVVDDHNCLSDSPFFRLFCGPKWFLFFLCNYVLVQTMVVTGLFSVVISTIEKRYNVSSFTTALMSSTYDITVLVVAAFVGYFGGKGHVPVWLGGGFIIMSIGAFVFAAPEFVGPQYSIDLQFLKDFCYNSAFTQYCPDPSKSVVWLFFVAQAIIGIGASPLWSLAPSYLDQIVKKKILPVYLGWLYGVAALGPAVGFAVGGAFLDYWVDIGRSDRPTGISNTDDQWVGAWWIGYAIAGVYGIWFALPLFLYPRFLPGTAWIRNENAKYLEVLERKLVAMRRHSIDHGVMLSPIASAHTPHPQQRPEAQPITDQDFAHNATFRESFCANVRNPTYVANVLGQAAEAFSISGFALFLPKAVQSIFGVSASTAAFAVGGITVPGAAGGIFFGGWLMKKLRASAKTTARFTWIFALMALLMSIGFYISCPTVRLAGITTPYPSATALGPIVGGVNGHNLSSSCNAACLGGCDGDRYYPVCGEDGVTYFSGCHAGCLGRTQAERKNADYTSCSCVVMGNNNGTSILGTARDGKCRDGCDNFPSFLVVLFFIMFITFLKNVPAITTMLRTMPREHRHTGMGLQNFVFRIFGTIPGPLIFGQLIDQTCIFRATDCGGIEQSNCREYNSHQLRDVFLQFSLIPQAISLICFFIAWYFFTAPDYERERTLFQEMDSDRSGAISKEEVVAWLRTERFADNPIFAMGPLRDVATRLLKLIDRNNDEMLSEEELEKFVDSLTIDQQNLLTKTLMNVTDEQRHRSLTRIFKALDLDHDGRVTTNEIRYWLNHEKSWKPLRDLSEKYHVRFGQLKDKIVQELDASGDGLISFEELKKFFRGWSLRDLRMFTSNQEYYAMLNEYLKHPTPQLARGLSELEDELILTKDMDQKEVDAARQKRGAPIKHEEEGKTQPRAQPQPRGDIELVTRSS